MSGNTPGASTVAVIALGGCCDARPKKNVVWPGPELSAAQTGRLPIRSVTTIVQSVSNTQLMSGAVTLTTLSGAAPAAPVSEHRMTPRQALRGDPLITPPRASDETFLLRLLQVDLARKVCW